jgi:hypothetical protein
MRATLQALSGSSRLCGLPEEHLGTALYFVLNVHVLTRKSRPIIGGLLARPAERWPDSFGKLALFREHPYFLPCMFAASFSLFCALFAFIFLKEVFGL